jgi:hypothetical protein
MESDHKGGCGGAGRSNAHEVPGIPAPVENPLRNHFIAGHFTSLIQLALEEDSRRVKT